MKKITSIFLALVLCLGLAAGAVFAAIDAPVFDQAAGKVSKGTVVNLSATTGAAIYFTTDGTDPEVYTSGGAIYVSGSAIQFTSSSAITINADTIVKAIAVMTSGAGIEVSDIASAEYTVTSGGSTPSSSTPAEDDTFPFTDVPADAYFRKPVEWAYTNGITAGTSKTLFSPYAGATRGQMIFFVWKASGSPEPTGTDMPFTDVAESAYYYKAVLWAAENNVTAGVSADKFAPDQTVTRAQAVTFLHNLAGKPAGGSEPFTDVNAGDYYADAVAWAYGKGITAGTSATTFNPGAACERGQIVTFLYKYFVK